MKKDNDREQRWSGYCQTTKAKITSAPQGDTAPRSIVVGTVHLLPADFYLGALTVALLCDARLAGFPRYLYCLTQAICIRTQMLPPE